MVVIEPMERESRTAFKERNDTINKVNEIINVINGRTVVIGQIETLDSTINDGAIEIDEIKTGIYYITTYVGTFILDITENDLSVKSTVIINVGTQGSHRSLFYVEYNNDSTTGTFTLYEISVVDIDATPSKVNLVDGTVKVSEYIIPEGD